MKAYQSDLAYVHDQGFRYLARLAAKEVLRHLKKKSLVVDLGAGTGILAKILTAAGHEIVGIELSSAMLRLAKLNAPRAKFKHGSLFRTPIPKCDAVVSIGECLNYQFDRHGLKRIKKLFQRIHARLTPDGFFLFDIATPFCSSGKVFSVGKDWAVLADKKVEGDVLTRAITVFRKRGAHYRRTEETHSVQLYEPAPIAKLLKRSGFSARRIRGYANQQFAKGVVGFLARKSASY